MVSVTESDGLWIAPSDELRHLANDIVAHHVPPDFHYPVCLNVSVLRHDEHDSPSAAGRPGRLTIYGSSYREYSDHITFQGHVILDGQSNIMQCEVLWSIRGYGVQLRPSLSQ
jgi:hypothetical protein